MPFAVATIDLVVIDALHTLVPMRRDRHRAFPILAPRDGSLENTAGDAADA